ncbi:hypothetical protein FA15DRAFT_672092 [Coprinopsis marcescibilis]|uniref:G-protein coupled receptors family 2 profile 2 domain-containing protein n=1 Tax=Coprinopsis marcescibilis TaxID=230819 RepID=A0A5C3KN36_COPMA|nr:hypothetical protein FA15DRAFT_672092 [Coprinopsis marcescibilis]
MDSDAVFTFEERLGISFVVQSSFMSAAAVSVLLVYALYRWLKRMRILKRDGSRVQADVTDSSLFLNLMLADLLQALGGMPSIRWMREGRITEGPLCTAQAVIKQIGINGVALTSLAIAVQTFSVLILRWRAPRRISKLLVLGVWIFTALVVSIPYAVHRNKPYYGITGYWCWIYSQRRTEQIVSEYLWVWTAAILMAVLYGFMFFVIRGFVVIEKGRVSWVSSRDRIKQELDEAESEEEEENRYLANLLLFYPAVYIFCMFPNTIARWMSFSGHTIPYQVTLFASALFAFSGMFNVILFFITRPELVVGPGQEPASPAIDNDTPSHAKFGHLPRTERANDTIGTNVTGGNKRFEQQASDGDLGQGFTTASAYKGQLILDSQLYQSPRGAERILPHSGSSVTTSPHSPTATATFATTSGQGWSPTSARPRTGGSRADEDDDNDDFGRLPG